MAEQHKRVLKKLGLPDALIEKLETMTADDLAKMTDDEFTNPVSLAFRTKLENDNDFLTGLTVEKLPDSLKKTLESGQYTRFMKEIEEVATKELHLSPDAFTDEDRKKLKPFVRKVNEMYVAKNGGANAEALKTLQQNLQKEMAEKEELKTGAQKLLADQETALKGTYGAKLQKMAGIVKLSKQAGLKIQPEYALPVILDKMNAKYSVEFDEDKGDFVLKQKANNKLAVLKADGKELTFDEEMTEMLKADKMIEEPKGKTKEEEQKEQEIRINNGTATVAGYINSKMEADMKAEAAGG